ncbi:hypothetical protein Tco_1193800 [Tanacetum coccineum]
MDKMVWKFCLRDSLFENDQVSHKQNRFLGINQKLNDWKNKSLSYAGRAQLMASVLRSMQVYWGSVFLLTKTVIKEIETCFKKFLWNSGNSCKGKAKVACMDVCKPKDQGGLVNAACAQLQLLSDYYCWKDYANKDEINDLSEKR